MLTLYSPSTVRAAIPSPNWENTGRPVGQPAQNCRLVDVRRDYNGISWISGLAAEPTGEQGPPCRLFAYYGAICADDKFVTFVRVAVVPPAMRK